MRACYPNSPTTASLLNSSCNSVQLTSSMHSSSPYHNVAAATASGISASSPLNQQPPPLPPSTTLQYTQSYGSEMQGASSSFTPVASSSAASYRSVYAGKKTNLVSSNFIFTQTTGLYQIFKYGLFESSVGPWWLKVVLVEQAFDVSTNTHR